MALTKEQIKEFKEEEKNASEFYEYRKIGSDLVEAGDKQWAKKLYKKAEDTAENSEDLFILAECVFEELSETDWAKNLYKKSEQDAKNNFEELRLLGDSLCDYLKDKDWAKKVYKKAESLAENDEELTDLSGSVSEYLGDEIWAKEILPNNTDNALPPLSDEEFSRCSKLNPIKFQASYLVWAYEKEMGKFTINLNNKNEEVEGYRIWEGKSSVDLTWKLPKSKNDALNILKKKNWKDKDIAYDDFEGLESIEGKGSTDYDKKENKLKQIEDFEGVGDTEVISFESGYGPSYISINFSSGEEIKFEKSEDNWTAILADDDKRNIGSYEELETVIKNII